MFPSIAIFKFIALKFLASTSTSTFYSVGKIV